VTATLSRGIAALTFDKEFGFEEVCGKEKNRSQGTF
jgi:hypothetical protein